MKRYVVRAVLLICLSACGCWTWQANSGSDAVDINPFAFGSNTPVIQLSNAPGYENGQPYDRR